MAFKDKSGSIHYTSNSLSVTNGRIPIHYLTDNETLRSGPFRYPSLTIDGSNWTERIYWNKFIDCRKCEQNQVFFKSGDPHPYCKNACEQSTMCGEVEVPEAHLEVCRVCNAFGQNCMVKGSPEPGAGIENADFVFYISAMETERCQKGMTVAYAAHCQQESALDRPIAGHANLCPSSIR